MAVQLSPTPEVITRPATPFVYLQVRGPFEQTAHKAWHTFWERAGGMLPREDITDMLGLSLIDPSKLGDEAYVYQAGVALKAKPERIPEGLDVREIARGRYARYLLTGSYAQLGEAFPLAISLLSKFGLRDRDDFCIERYLNTPADTPEEKLMTELLIPIL